MKNQALFSSQDKSEKLKCSLLQFLFVKHFSSGVANRLQIWFW